VSSPSTSAATPSVQELQKKYESEFDAYKDAVRYWHAVLTLQRPTDYGGWLVALLLSLAFLGTRDWSNGTTFFMAVFVYFAVALGLDFAGPLPFAKFVAGKYDNSEADPFVRLAALAATVESKLRGYWQDMRELRRLNNVKFTFQVCFAALVGALVCSYVSGFTLTALALLAVFVVPPVVVKKIHLQAWAAIEPHAKPLIAKAQALIGGAKAAAAPADAKKTN
jgi:threonine/homoserine efflux transporter RhtA